MRVLDFQDGFESSVEPTTVVAPASEVSVVPTGNLASDNVQEALEELQADVDTRATSTAMTAGDASTLASANTYADAGDAATLTAANEYTDTSVAALVNAAPATLDTLDELAASLGDDPNFATTVSTALGNRVRVDTAAQGLTGTQKTNAKTNLDLQNVSNTSDMDKPVSTAQAAALALKASLSGAEVLTNKDIDGGTASNTSRITLPKADKTTLDALTRKAGTIVFDTTSGKPYYDDGTTLQLVGSGSGGGVNLITNGDAESGNSGWDGYGRSTPATRPGSASGTFTTKTLVPTVSSTNPLSGTNSFVISKPSGNQQSQLLFRTITVDEASAYKVLQITFDYKLLSGTFQAGSSTQDSDLIIYISHSGNQWTEPSNIKLLSNSTTISTRHTATFQSVGAGSYRLCFYVPTTNTATWDLQIDNISVSPSAYVYGTPVTDWTTVTGVVTANMTTNTVTTAKRRRVGDNYEYNIHLGFTGAPNAVSLAIALTDTIDLSKMVATSSLDANVRLVAGATTYQGTVQINSATSLGIYALNAAGTYASPVAVTQAVPATFGSGDYIDINFKAPIVGLSSSVQMSDSADTRVVAASAAVSGAGTTNSTTPINYDTVVYDTHGCITTGIGVWRYTCKVAGFYRINIGQVAATASGNNAYIYKGGSLAVTLLQNVQANVVMGNSATIELKVGEYFDIRNGSGTILTLTADSAVNRIYVERVTGPSAIAASEEVSCRYTNNTAATVSTSNSLLPWSGRTYDSHGAMNVNGTFTAPISGRYRFSGSLITQTVSLATNNTFLVYAYKNGSSYSECGSTHGTGASTNYRVKFSDTIQLNAGDTLQIYAQASTATTLYPDTTFNFISIEKVK